jgi:predicted nucleic acid-binding protein
MNSPVLVDASAWIAIVDRGDYYHSIAQSTYDDLLTDEVLLVTTNWTGYEALSIVKSRIGYTQMISLWEQLNDPETVRLVYITEEIELAGLDIFLRYRDKTWGVVDCASLVVMDMAGCNQAFAFDTHFREASRQRGFEVIPIL